MHDDTESTYFGSGLLHWLAGNGYAPHSGCFLGDNNWVAAYVAANWIIALAYTLVALLIMQRMRRAAHIPKTIMGASLLGIFVTCAGGHFLAGVTTILWPGYRFETMWNWLTTIPAWVFLAHHKRFSLIVEGPHMIAETREELAAANARLAYLVTQDGLTGLKNHRAFQERLAEELKRGARYATPLALLMIDVDNFKQLNDCFGHPAGDEVLKRIAQILEARVRDIDMAARYGGEEFVVLLPHTDVNAAMIVAERIRASIASEPWKLRPVTVSVGVATLQEEGDVPTTLIERADKALYRSKAQGRNQVTCAD